MSLPTTETPSTPTLKPLEAFRNPKVIMPTIAGHIKRIFKGPLPRSRPGASASTTYAVVDRPAATTSASTAWLCPDVALRQHAAYQQLLRDMRAGRPRRDLLAAARAVEATKLTNPTILEVGCGSGYYFQVFTHLLKQHVQYTGLDYSPAMIDLAQGHQPTTSFIKGDATNLPFDDNTFDIVFNGVSLMHISDYESVIKESARVSTQWCIVHSLPLLHRRPTTFLTKKAYGRDTIEVIFNHAELVELLKSQGLTVCQSIDSIKYDLEQLLGEKTTTKTLVCELSCASE